MKLPRVGGLILASFLLAPNAHSQPAPIGVAIPGGSDGISRYVADTPVHDSFSNLSSEYITFIDFHDGGRGLTLSNIGPLHDPNQVAADIAISGVDDGAPYHTIISDVPVTVNSAFQGEQQNTFMFDTQIQGITLSGGGLPAGFEIRETPGVPLTGGTDIPVSNPSLVPFNMYSYFDLYTEFSTNGGQTWSVGQAPEKLVLSNSPAAVPEPSPLAFMTLGTVALAFKRKVVRRRN